MPESQLVEKSDPKYLMPGEAAALLGVTTTTLAAWAEAGVIEAIRLASGHRRYAEASVRAYATRARQSA